MKGIKHILFAAAFFVPLMLSSCILSYEMLSAPYGLVQVEIAEGPEAVTRIDGETMETIRLIVFTDLDTTPKVESNKLFRLSEGEFEIIPSTGPDVPSRVRFTLKVQRRANATEDDKILIVAVINEPEKETPEGIAFTETLSDPDITIEDLEALELDIATFVKSDHLSLLDNVNIPMTGALWTDYTKLLDERLVPSNAPLELMVHRAIARVDVYLKRETTKVNSVDVILDPNLTMTAGTIITLDKTYDRTNLVMHTDADGAGTLGTIQTVDPGDFISPKSWRILSGEQAVSQFETTPVCVFYTPERSCLTNNEKLKLSVSIKTPEGTTRSGDLVIKEAKDKAGIVHTVDKVERNHIYKVTVTITANGVTGDVIDWGEQPIYTDF